MFVICIPCPHVIVVSGRDHTHSLYCLHIVIIASEVITVFVTVGLSCFKPCNGVLTVLYRNCMHSGLSLYRVVQGSVPLILPVPLVDRYLIFGQDLRVA